MSKRLTDREKLLFKLGHLTDSQVKDVLNYISKLDVRKLDRSPSESPDDDLVTMLSAAYENRRARQVFEWESARRRAEARAIAQRNAAR